MASGVNIHDNCKTYFVDMKMNKAYQYIIFALSADQKQIIVEKTGEKGAPYEEFLENMKVIASKGECRYAVYDVPSETKEGQKTQKIVFFMWSPDESTVKQKMVYASSKSALTHALGSEGIAKFIQASDLCDLNFAAVQQCVKQK